MRANNAKAVRHYLKSGEIPSGSRGRKTPLEKWKSLRHMDEFADLLKKPEHNNSVEYGEIGNLGDNSEPNSSDSMSQLQLQSVGVRGMLMELVSALDSSLNTQKLKIAWWTAVVLAGIFVVTYLFQMSQQSWDYAPFVVPAIYAVIVVVAMWSVSVASVILSQCTFVELSQLRPAQWSEAKHGLTKYALTWNFCVGLVLGLLVLGLLGLQWLNSWLDSRDNPAWLAQGNDYLLGMGYLLQMLFQILALPVLAFTLLFAAIILIEEASPSSALRLWWQMVRGHGSRLFLYEFLAVFIALMATIPFALPVEWASINAPPQGIPALFTGSVGWFLRGLVLTPAIAYLNVANVFIYLHLRYQLPMGR